MSQVLTDEQIDALLPEPFKKLIGGNLPVFTTIQVREVVRTALSTSHEASGEAVPEDWQMFACNVADECGDTPVPDACAERLEEKALRLLESIGAIKAATTPSPQAATTPSAEPARTTERHIALREAHCIEKIDKFFAARRSLDGPDERKCFEEGFKRGFDVAEQCFPAAKQPAGEVRK